MAGYVKVWTTATDDRAYLSMRGNERSIWFQLIMEAKKQRDNGQVWFRNESEMAQKCAFHRQTCYILVTKVCQKWQWNFQKHPDGTIEITIRNYKHWQEIGAKEMNDHYRNSVPKVAPIIPDKTRPEQTIPYIEIVEHLNSLTGSKFRHTSQSTKRYIQARWNEGFVLDDFLYVNQVKAEEWLGTEREKYLRPETLYGNKFEGYRQQRRIPRQYSDKTNRALAAGMAYLQRNGVEVETRGQAEISSDAIEITSGVPQRPE